MSGLPINLKLEAERLTSRCDELLDIAKKLAQTASTVGDAKIAGELGTQVQNILKIAEDISVSATRLVGR
jgi:hypothetical protein